MKFVSTRKLSPPLLFSNAIVQSLAPDHGLFVPERFPQFAPKDFEGRESVAEIASHLLLPFLEGDPLAAQLNDICQVAFNFSVPLVFLEGHSACLELFHGPTAAFKDFGARFLAECLIRSSPRKRHTIIVATSGDTGGAVAAAFDGKPNVNVVLLFPKGKVSSRQQTQLTCWGENVHAFAVKGSFDDCQRMAKEALSDWEWQSEAGLLSANSINIGRILPQMAYYAAASLWYLRSQGRQPGFVVPTGNLGNATAALWAKRVGLPIREVALATNANRPISNYFLTGRWETLDTLSTLANAMDVGNPSNMERLLNLYPNLADLKQDVSSRSVSDIEISQTIVEVARKHQRVCCPHTATAFRTLAELPKNDWVVVETAHAAKFDAVVEPLIGHAVAVPEALAQLLDRPTRYSEIEASLDALRQVMEEV